MTTADDRTLGLEGVIAANLNLVGPLRNVFGELDPACEVIDALEVLLAQEIEHVAEQVRAHLASDAVRNKVAVALHDRIMPGQPHPDDEDRSERPCREWADVALRAVLAATLGEGK